MRGVKSIFSTAFISVFTLLAALSLALSAASEASAQTTLTSATYDAATGELVVTGSNIAIGDVIAVNKLTLTGEGAASYALTTSNVMASSATAFSITLNAADKAAVNQIINKNGTSSTGGTTYNLAAADDWDANVTAGDTSDAINAVTASNVLISQTITFGPNPGPQSPGVAKVFFVNATGGASGNPIVFTSLTPSGCGILTSNLVAPGLPGICTIAANQAGNANYRVAPQATQDIVIEPSTQTITFGANPGPVNFSAGGTFSVIATAYSNFDPSTVSVTLTSLTTGVCTISATIVSMFTPGTCTIAANSAGSVYISPAAQVTQSITINLTPQNIAFDVRPSIVKVGDMGTVFIIVGGFSGNPIVFTSNTPTVCTVTGITVAAIASGTCTIAANQAGNAYFAAAPETTQSFNIVPVVTLSSVVSRKPHNGIDRDVVIDHLLTIGGNLSTEPRAIGAGHRIVFQFSGPINLPGFPGAVDSGMFDIGSTSTAINPLANNEVIVTLTGVPDNKRVTVTLTNVNGIAIPFAASMGFLVGDVNGSRTINSSDISAVKARSGQSTDALNFKFDVNASGTVNSSDISTVKARSGLTLAP